MRYDAAVIGLGNMGRRIAIRLSTEGRNITVWNRTPDRTQELGLDVSSGFGEALRDTAVLLMVLSDYASSRALLEQHAASIEGKTIILFNSGLPGDARDLAVWVEKVGGSYIDVAILGYPTDIGSERAMLFYAGAEGQVAGIIKGLLAPLGPRQVWVGADFGAAKNFDAALLCRNYLWMTSYLQSLALAHELGLNRKQFTDTALSLIGPLWGNIQRALEEIEAGHFREAEQASISVHRSALDIIATVADQSKINYPILEAVHAAVTKAESLGFGEKEMAALYKVFERPASA